MAHLHNIQHRSVSAMLDSDDQTPTFHDTYEQRKASDYRINISSGEDADICHTRGICAQSKSD